MARVETVKKATRIHYDPFANAVSFEVASSPDGPWRELDERSELLVYTMKRVLFSNCVADIVASINENQNSSPDGLEILFTGPADDYELLRERVAQLPAGGTGPLTCRHVGVYPSAAESLATLRSDYGRISGEFQDYMPGGDKFRESPVVGQAMQRFVEVISDAIPICVIGNYSVGKSALINALIGDELLPSKVNPSTAKNVRVTQSDRYVIRLTLVGEDGEPVERVLDVEDGGITARSSEDDLARRVAAQLNAWCPTDVDSARSRMRAALESFNEAVPGSPVGDVGWNVHIEVPFTNTILSESAARVQIFDTPGDDNAQLDRADHRRALDQLMEEQVGALPIIVTSRDKVAARSTADLRARLDEFSENFAVPSCLVVLSKCDTYTRSELEQAVPAEIRNWHGKSIILHVTPVGALGLRRDRDKPWDDDGYKELFEAWSERQRGKRRISLPEHNIYPGRPGPSMAALGVGQAEFDTGIPSLESEILEYMAHCADYKKCTRGRQDLLTSLTEVHRHLEDRRAALESARRQAVFERRDRQRELLGELGSIALGTFDGLAEELYRTYEAEVSDYCSAARELAATAWDEHSTEGWEAMESAFDRTLAADCQERLVMPVYAGPDGAGARIRARANELADDYSSALERFVSSNAQHLTTEGRRRLDEAISHGARTPQFGDGLTDVGILQSLIDRVASTRLRLVESVWGLERARTEWLEGKEKSVAGRLRSRTNLLGRWVPGAFEETALRAPIAAASSQLIEWSQSHRQAIEAVLDSENTVLVGLDARIDELEAEVCDLEERLTRMKDVEDELNALVNPAEVR